MADVGRLVLATSVGMAFFWLAARFWKKYMRRERQKRSVVLRVIGCFHFYSDEDSSDAEDECWSNYSDPRATLSGLKHSVEFQAHARDNNLDVDHEEEKLLLYKSLRKYDPESFFRLLTLPPDDYKEYSAITPPSSVVVLDYLFLSLGIILARSGLMWHFFAWVAIHVCMLSSRSTLFSIGLKSRGYYVINDHNKLAEPLRIACPLALELILVHYTGFWGAALSLAMKLRTKKRQSLMEYIAGIWIILETKKSACIG